MLIATMSPGFSGALAVTCLVLYPLSASAQAPQPAPNLEMELQEVRSENTAIRERLSSLAEQKCFWILLTSCSGG
jgi:hypothetical protein